MAKRKRNPDLDTSDFTDKVIPGFGAYAVTRFAARAAYKTTEKRAPGASAHAAVGAGVLAAGLVWAFGDRIKQLAPYRDALLIGAGAATLQSIAQTYMPQYGWIVGDIQPNRAAQPAQAGPSLAELLASDDLEVVPLLPPANTKIPGPAPMPVSGVEEMAAEDYEIDDGAAQSFDLGDFSEANDELFQ